MRVILNLTADTVSNSAGNRLVPSGNKPLPEPMFTKVLGAKPQSFNVQTTKIVMFNCYVVCTCT